MSTWYRVEPNSGDPGCVGEIALCCKYLIHVFHYVRTWHGTNCVLYEIEGDPIVERVEDFQIAYNENEKTGYEVSEHVMIPVAEVRMTDWWQIGDFTVRKYLNGKTTGKDFDEVYEWEFTPCRRVGERGALRR